MKIQIYLQNGEDAKMCVQAGVDFIGLVCDERNLLPDSLSYKQAKEVFAAVPSSKMKVALSVESESKTIIEMVNNVKPDVLHLAGKALISDRVKEIRRAIPFTKIMQAIPMNSPQPLEMAREYQAFCDYFILDSDDPQAKDIGATGTVHNWNLSRAIVLGVNIPVFLAGGLSPDNVEEAIKKVGPWGVDSFSKTNSEIDRKRKDAKKIELFIKHARAL